MVSPDTQFSCNGVVKQWRYKFSHRARPFKALVFRPLSEFEFKLIGINDISSAKTKTGEEIYDVPEGDRITVQVDDVIGWSFPKYSAVPGFAPLRFNNAAERIFVIDYFTSGASLHKLLSVNETYTFYTHVWERKYSIVAIVETNSGKIMSNFKIHIIFNPLLNENTSLKHQFANYTEFALSIFV